MYTTSTTKLHCTDSSKAVPARPFGKTRLVTREREFGGEGGGAKGCGLVGGRGEILG